jgi:rubrerythrin
MESKVQESYRIHEVEDWKGAFKERMGMFFSGKELLDIAVKIEKSGAAFYETMVGCARSKTAKTAFKYLADQERQHIKAYHSMLKAVVDAPPPESYTEEYDEYLKSLVKSAVFSDEAAACTMAENASSDAEGIDFGIRAEKDSILFYTELQDLVRRSDAKIVGNIIEEERSHLMRLSELKSGLAKA